MIVDASPAPTASAEALAAVAAWVRRVLERHQGQDRKGKAEA